jgi:phospholipid/cholesterol/gamma-HCH transport system substrate-binding protein
MTVLIRSGRKRMVYGIGLALGCALLLVAVFSKPAIIAALRPGESIQIELSRAYKLDAAMSQVKIAGTPVGVVRSTTQTNHGTALVTLKVDTGTREKLGSAPTAAVRPTTILGGRYYVDLRPGGLPGRFDDTLIPVARTNTPVELDEVLSALQPRAVQGLQHTLTSVDETLRAGGADELDTFASRAPGPLNALGPVLQAARGTEPDTDLARLVSDADRAGKALITRDGQLGDVIGSLDTTTAAVARESGPLAQGIDNLPAALVAIDHAASDVSVTLDKLRTTAPLARPTAKALDPLLRRLDPMLDELRPVAAKLPPLMRDARPLTRQLVPVSELGTDVFDDLRGPVLDRINGPVLAALNTRWTGTGRFAGSGNNGNMLYQEIASMFSNLANSSVHHDQNGSSINFEVGANWSELSGLPFGLDHRTNRLDGIGGPPR